MSKITCVAPLGATAIALGLALAVPGIAVADDSTSGSQTSSAADTADTGARETKSSISRRPVRAAKIADQVAADVPTPTVSRPAAARGVSEPPQARSAAKPDRTRRASPTSARTALPTADSSASAQAVPSAPESPAAPESAATATPALSTTAEMSSEVTTAPTVFRRAPRAAATLGTLSSPVGALTAAASTDWLSALFSPIQAFFEGIALLVRRTFFNQAPSLSPVQITGQSEGLITGDLGAVDPEADPIVYSITSAPQHGSVVIGSDGSYTYTPGQDFTGTDAFTVAAADTGFHINLLNLFRPSSTTASVVVRQGAAAAGSLLQFQFFYGSGSQYWSPEARSSLQAAADALSAYIVVSTPVVVTFDVTGEYTLLSSTLATAGSEFISSDPGFLPTVVQNKILTGVDSNGSTADGEINWNFAQPWVTGDSVGYGQYDLQSVAMHELLHTVGFLSYVDAPGYNTGTSWTVFDSFLVNSAGSALIGSDFTWDSAYDPNLTGSSGGVYFGGPGAVAAYGARVPLYTPSPWASGSSLSHLNDRVFAGGNRRLMNAQVGSGQGIRVLSAVELGILADLGYTVTS